MATGRGAHCAQRDEGGLSTRVAVVGTVTAGSGRPPRLSPAYPPFYEPLRADRGPYLGLPQPRPAGHSPWMTLHMRGTARQPPGWGDGGGAVLGTPLLAHRARLAGPPRARGRTPGPRRRGQRTATARTPLPRRGRPHDRGRPPLARAGAAPGPHTWEPGGKPSCPARHTRAGPAPWLWAAGTATPLEGGIVTVRHMAPTLGEPDSPELCPATTM